MDLSTTQEEPDMLEIEERIRARLLEWGAHLPEFEFSHAAFGAHCAARYLGERLVNDEERMFVLGLDFTLWYWLDDRSDRHLHAPIVDFQQLTDTALGRWEPAPPRSPEVEFILELSERMRQFAQTTVDHQWWQITAASVVDAYAREAEVSRSRQPLSYAEYLAIGSRSCAVLNLLASASLLGELGLASRRFESPIEQGVRYLCTVARLENDWHSYKLDREEGCLANAVWVMGRYMATEKAIDFVASERQAYEAMLGGVLAELGEKDPFTWLARNALSTHASYYEIAKARYLQAE
jgi:hypothetical protein